MGMAVADLVTRLKAAVPARDEVPAEADFSQHVADAVEQLSVDLPMLRYTTLAVVSGTAGYSLAADFLFLIRMETPSNPTGIPVRPAGQTWEQYEITDKTITFFPTPDYSVARGYRYAARHVAAGGSYPHLSAAGAAAALLYAQGLALRQQANGVAGSGWKYQIGDEMVDKSGQAGGLRSQADRLFVQYQQAVDSLASGQTSGRTVTWDLL